MFKPLIISGLCVVSAVAQTSATKLMVEQSGQMGITAVMAGPSATIPGAPYSAQAVTQRVQTLSDGNRITQTITNSVARDNKGRVYREESLPGSLSGGGEAPHLILIDDPVASQHFTVDPNTKTVYKTAAAEQKRVDEAAFTITRPMQPLSSADGEIHIVKDKANLDEATAATTTDLGSQIIDGVQAKGTRITRTIPAGSIGNDLPIIITTETWYSPELKVLLMSKSVDPRMGESTYKLTNLIRAEPSASLFQIPADYTVKEHSNNVVYVKKIDK
jgi:hypothetical protein